MGPESAGHGEIRDHQGTPWSRAGQAGLALLLAGQHGAIAIRPHRARRLELRLRPSAAEVTHRARVRLCEVRGVAAVAGVAVVAAAPPLGLSGRRNSWGQPGAPGGARYTKPFQSTKTLLREGWQTICQKWSMFVLMVAIHLYRNG